MDAIKIGTTTTSTFCSIQCIEFPECKSFSYLTTSDTENCLLSSSADGLATTTKSVVYRKNDLKAIRVRNFFSNMNVPFLSIRCRPTAGFNNILGQNKSLNDLLLLKGCKANPCLEGTCEDLCEEPYYICRCAQDEMRSTCQQKRGNMIQIDILFFAFLSAEE